MRRFPWLTFAIPLALISLALFTPAGAQPCPIVFCGGTEYFQLVPLVAQLPPTPVPTATPIPTATPRPIGVVPNGNFELGATGWAQLRNNVETTIHIRTTFGAGVGAHTGAWAAWLGGSNNVTDAIGTRVTIAPNQRYLIYWRRITSTEACAAFDIAGVALLNDDGETTDDEVLDAFELCTRTAGGWVRRVLDVRRFAGQTRLLIPLADMDSSRISSLYVDDFSLKVDAEVAVAEADVPDPILVQRLIERYP